MSFRQSTNEWLSIIMKIGVIVIIAAVVGFAVVSIIGNIVIANNAIKPPPEDTEYSVTVKGTGQQNLTSDLQVIKADDPQIFLLTGYYELSKNKWVYRDIPLTMDEFYYGEIIIGRR